MLDAGFWILDFKRELFVFYPASCIQYQLLIAKKYLFEIKEPQKLFSNTMLAGRFQETLQLLDGSFRNRCFGRCDINGIPS